jgi:hypothetical protein
LVWQIELDASPGVERFFVFIRYRVRTEHRTVSGDIEQPYIAPDSSASFDAHVCRPGRGKTLGRGVAVRGQ